MKKEDLINALTIIINIIGILFLAFAFVKMELNPNNWNESTRVVLALACLLSSVIVIVALYLNGDIR